MGLLKLADLITLSINSKTILEVKKGGIGLHSLSVIFRQKGNNGNKKLDLYGFTEALNTFGISAKVCEV